MSEKPKLNLIFLTFLSGGNKIHSYKLSFAPNNLYFIQNSEETHEIPEEVFKLWKDKAIIYIILYDVKGECLTTIKYPIYYYSINTIYIEENYIGNGYNIEIDFKHSKDLSLKINEKEIKSLDSIGTKDRHKITLINFNISTITANQKDIDILQEIVKCNEKSPINFYRISINMEDPEIKKIVQPIKEVSSPKVHLLNEKKIIFDEFYKKLKELIEIKNNDNYKEKYELIVEEYTNKIEMFDYELNKSKDYLEQYFEEYSIDFEIILDYELFGLLIDGEEKYKENQEFFKKIVEGMEQFFNKIKDETNIKIYDKIGLLSKICNAYLICKNFNDLNELDLFYIISSECAENSIIKKTKKMFDEFISQLSDDSKLFKYLLNLDSGVGYYNNEKVYTFDMSNLEMIKGHLNELFPRVILFYNYNNDNVGDTNKNSGCIAFNVRKFTLLKEEYETIIFDKEIKDEDFSNDMAVNMFIILFHEFGGHKKISYNRNLDNDSSSPKKIINENNKLIELKRFSSYKDDDNEYILSSENSEEGVGESGKYLELCFGKHNKELITSLLIYIDNKGKLLNRPDLFVGENFDVLQKYIILKNEVKDNNIKIDLPKNLSIEDEIDELEKIIKNSNIKKLSTENIKPQKKIKKFKVIGKKRKREKDISNDKKYNKRTKHKDKHMKINIRLDKNKKNELKLEEEHEEEKELEVKKKSAEKTEVNTINVVDYNNTIEYVKYLKKQIREKYGFKNRIEMIKGIRQIINNKNSLSTREICNLHLVLRFLYEKA